MRKLILGCLLGAALCSVSCNPSCTQGSGAPGEEVRAAETFSSVELDMQAMVVIRKGNAAGIKIIAQDNIRELITASVSGNRLRIESASCFKTEEPVRIEITTADLTKVEVSGSGRVTVADTFQVKEATFSMSGSGNIEARMIAASLHTEVSGSGTVTLIGSANEMNSELAGSGNIDAREMPCNKAGASVSGSGNIRLYALEKLKAEIAGSGSIYYKGNPDVKSSISGSGKVVSEN